MTENRAPGKEKPRNRKGYGAFKLCGRWDLNLPRKPVNRATARVLKLQVIFWVILFSCGAAIQYKRRHYRVLCVQ